MVQLMQWAPSDVGWCYLDLVVSSAHDKFVSAAGFNPHGQVVQAWLGENRSIWAPGRFKVVYGRSLLQDSDVPYVQVHVERCKEGVTVSQFLGLNLAGTRVGMDVQRPGVAQVPTGEQHAPTPASGGGQEVNIKFNFNLRSNEGEIVLSPRNSYECKQHNSHYESALLTDFKMNASVRGGSSAVLYFGIGTSYVKAANLDGFLKLNDLVEISGTDDGIGRGEFQLGRSHAYGKEVRGVATGNPDPVFHWMLDTGTTSTATVTGVLTFYVSGRGNAPPFSLTPKRAT